MQKIIEVKSIGWALRIQAIICTVLGAVALLLTKERIKQTRGEIKLYDKEVFSSFGFYLLDAWLFFTLLGYVALLYTLGDFTVSLGYSYYQGSIVSSMVSVGAIIGRPIIGWISDRYGVVSIGIIFHILTGIFAIAMWIPTRNYATAIMFALIQGSIMGTVWATVATTTVRIVGLKKLVVTFGMVWVLSGVSALIAPIIVLSLKSDPPKGKLAEPTQYTNVAIFVGVCYLFSASILFVMRGWLSARDHLAGESTEGEETSELDITVPIKDAIEKCFTWKTIRKI